MTQAKARMGNWHKEEEETPRTEMSVDAVVRACLMPSVRWEGIGLLIGAGRWVGNVSKIKELKKVGKI